MACLVKHSMARKVFDLDGAQPDEIAAIHNLLRRNRISYYETPDSNFGRSTAALWVKRDRDFGRACEIIARYEKERLDRRRKNAEKKSSSIFDTDSLLKEPEPLRRRVLRYSAVALIFIVVIWMLIFGFQRP